MKRSSTDWLLGALLTVLTLLFLSATLAPAAEDRRERVLKDRQAMAAHPQWIYNDLAKGFAEAGRTGQPMLVVLRCLP